MKFGSARCFCIFAALFLGWGVALAAEANPASAADGPIPVSIQNNPNFADMPAQLQTVVNALGFHSVNRFCVVGYATGDDDYPLAYIYWPVQNKIIAWASGSGQTIFDSGEFSDLTRDVLPDGAVTDDYLHRSDVKIIIQDCWKYGRNYTIKKTIGGWSPISLYSQFSTVKAQLQDIVDHDATQRTNKFCVIGQKDGAYLAAYVYWQTKDQLVFWLPNPQDQFEPDALTDSVFQIDLKHDLRNKEDAADQGNEMQRSYVEDILKACRQSGQNFIINKS